MNPCLILDFETFSEVDLKSVGAWEYSKHPSTEIICAAWTVGERHQHWTKVECRRGDDLKILELLLGDGPIVSHNAYFEQCILRNVLGFQLPSELFICTAAMAASHALPRDLEGACLALNLPVKKDMEGRRLMMKYMKPRKPSKHNASTRWSDPEELERIRQYCATDIEAERRLFERLPLLNETERKVWCLDQKINFRGFKVDRNLVTKILSLIEKESTNLLEEFKYISKLESPQQLEKTREILSHLGVILPNLTAKTVQDALLADSMHPRARRILELRQALSKSSTKKYEAFEKRSRTDGRIRDSQLYHAASTGRWGGSGVQPHNLPRSDFSSEAIGMALSIIQDIA